MLDKVYYGNSLQDWGISILIILGALLINKFVILLNRKVIRKITVKSATRIDDIFFNAVEKPILMGIVLLAIWIALGRLEMDPAVFGMIKKSYELLVVLNITWFFARFISSLIEENIAGRNGKTEEGRFGIDAKLLPLIKRGVLIIVWFTGIVTAFHNIGITITTLIGTLGIGGIAFALAAQDTIKNIFGGITIFTDHTFRIGDLIKFDSVEGTVVDIGLRSTRLLTYDKRLVTIPNYKLTDALITNISSEPGRRIVMDIGLTYDTAPEKMQEAINILKGMPGRIPGVKERDLVAVFHEFGDSALIIRFIYFIRKQADNLETKSKVNFEILNAFTQAGLDFAFPTQTLYFGNSPENPDIGGRLDSAAPESLHGC
ncbi:MAG: mechanosensitive ion channel family protein [Tannerella sp.]|jgi:MscS family membrane protein|nr:mechanosensitive ion channel family protein [Tannerella sp.]